MTLTGPIIQAAGVRGLAEALMLAECGVTDLGFPLKLPVHKEDMDEHETALVIAGLPKSVRPVLITYLADPGEVIALAGRIGVTRVQLHGDLPAGAAREIKRLNPGMEIIKSLVVGKENTPALKQMLVDYAPRVDAFLTDTYDPETGAMGATGRIHDWSVSGELVSASRRPLILAGGLTPDNVRRAVNEVKPAGVDVHTGIEGPGGMKDPELCKKFVREARAGFADVDRRA